MTTKMKDHKIRVDNDVWKQFVKLCNLNNVSSAKMIRTLINQFIDRTAEIQQNSSEITELIDEVYERTGRVPIEIIQNRTRSTIAEEQAVSYCKRQGYPLIKLEWESLRKYRGEFE